MAKQPDSTGRPIVICGPSGVGKGTLIQRACAEFKDGVGFTVSHTTRAPRVGEQDGVNYHFTDKEAFLKAVADNQFVEHAVVHGQLYGTSVQTIQDVIGQGNACFLDIDVQGALQLAENQRHLDPVFLFITAPSREALVERLEGRQSETPETLAARLKTFEFEMKFLEEHPDLFDRVLQNDELDVCYAELREFLIGVVPALAAASAPATPSASSSAAVDGEKSD